MLRHRSTSVAIDLSALNREEKIRATARFLHTLRGLRAETGAPHWMIVDEAHHVFRPAAARPRRWPISASTGVCLITNEPASVASGRAAHRPARVLDLARGGDRHDRR